MEIKIYNRKLLFKKENISRLSQTPGVYIFLSKDGTPLYIGKSNNLKSRVSSYLIKNLALKTKNMINETKYFSIIKVGSELEALLLEAKLVRKIKPKYNISLKDDKNPLYILITKEKYPRVLTARKKDQKIKYILFLGPFPSSKNVYSVLRILRKIFPFSNHKLSKRPCIYSQIGLCDPCPNEIENIKNNLHKNTLRNTYLSNIKMLKGVLNGNIDIVKNKLKKDMHNLSKYERFEEAIKIREKIQLLEYITQPITKAGDFIQNPNLLQDIRKGEIDSLKKILKNYINQSNNLQRIECFDVSHISGVKPAASMVTFINGDPDKSLYRRFYIHQRKSNDDLASLKEVAERREKHLSDWGKPDLIIVDGGKAQVNVFLSVYKKHKINVVGLAKRYESLIMENKNNNNKLVQYKIPNVPALHLVQRLRDDAHNFARKYHHKLVEADLFKEL